jgi:phage/plasmid-like protein (TIGR03299 family)
MSKGNIDGMFSVREVPWHREGNVPDYYPDSWDEARQLAGLAWDLERVPAWIRTATAEDMKYRVATILRNPEYARLTQDEQIDMVAKVLETGLRRDPDYDRIRRNDTDVSLSYQMKSWHEIYLADLGPITEAILKAGQQAGRKVLLETGGCLDGGKKIWMLIKLDEPMKFTNTLDRSYTFPYFAFTGRNDGTAAWAARLTAVRIICQNTFDASEAEGRRTGAAFSFSHRAASWRDQIDRARQALQFAEKQIDNYVEAMDHMLSMKVTPAQTGQFITRFVAEMRAATSGAGGRTELTERNDAKKRARIAAILNGPTIDGAGIAGTPAALFQAAGELLDWDRNAHTPDTRLNRNVLELEPLKAVAAKLAREAVNA